MKKLLIAYLLLPIAYCLLPAEPSLAFKFSDLQDVNWSQVVKKSNEYITTIQKIQDGIETFKHVLEGGLGFDDINNIKKIVKNIDSLESAIDLGLFDFDSLTAKTEDNGTELVVDSQTGEISAKEVVDSETINKVEELANSNGDEVNADGQNLQISATKDKGEASTNFIESAENTIALNKQISQLVSESIESANKTATNNVSEVADFGSSKEALTAIYTTGEITNGHTIAQTGLLSTQVLLQGMNTSKISELATKISKLSVDNANIISSLANSYRLMEEVLQSSNINNALVQKNNATQDAQLTTQKRMQHYNAVKNFSNTLASSTYTIASSTKNIDTTDDGMRNGMRNGNIFAFNSQNIDPNDSLSQSKQFKDMKELSSEELNSLKKAIQAKNNSNSSQESGQSIALINDTITVLDEKYNGLDNAKKILELSGDKPLSTEDLLKYVTVNGDSIFAATKGKKDSCPTDEKYSLKQTLDCLNGVLFDINNNPNLANTKYQKTMDKIKDAISVGNDILSLLQTTNLLPSKCNNDNGEEIVITDLSNIETLLNGTQCKY